MAGLERLTNVAFLKQLNIIIFKKTNSLLCLFARITTVTKEKSVKMAEYGDFKLASQARIHLPIHVFQGGPWVHMATAQRALSEYVALLHEPTGKVYLEQITYTGRFTQIEDDKLWVDLLNFLVDKGVLGFDKDKEIIIGENWNA